MHFILWLITSNCMLSFRFFNIINMIKLLTFLFHIQLIAINFFLSCLVTQLSLLSDFLSIFLYLVKVPTFTILIFLPSQFKYILCSHLHTITLTRDIDISLVFRHLVHFLFLNYCYAIERITHLCGNCPL